MTLRKEQILVGALFILVFVTFSLADRDTKKNEPNLSGIEQKLPVLASGKSMSDSVKAYY